MDALVVLFDAFLLAAAFGWGYAYGRSDSLHRKISRPPAATFHNNKSESEATPRAR